MKNSPNTQSAPGRPTLAGNSHRRSGWVAARLLAILLAALVWPAMPATESTTLARMDLRELSLRAAIIARVRCVASAPAANAGRVWTQTTFEVIAAWKGAPPARFTIRLPGGEAAGLRMTVEGAPRFSAGEEAVLFLDAGGGRPINIVSWAQGTFRIQRNARTGAEEAAQDTAGLRVLDSRTGKWSEGGIRRIPLAELQARVARAIAEVVR